MLGRLRFAEGNAVMSADHNDALKTDAYLYISRLLYAATSKGYRLAFVVAATAEYAEQILKQKTPECGHATIETAPLGAKGDAHRNDPADWVPDEARRALANVGAMKGFYYSELFYSISEAECP
jgi:hypothetical protein